MTRQEFAARFKAARIAAKLTQQQAADWLGVPQPRIAEYENGARMPPVDRLMEIMAALKLDARTIFPEFFRKRG